MLELSSTEDISLQKLRHVAKHHQNHLPNFYNPDIYYLSRYLKALFTASQLTPTTDYKCHGTSCRNHRIRAAMNKQCQ